jgi:hypothetical protein
VKYVTAYIDIGYPYQSSPCPTSNEVGLIGSEMSTNMSRKTLPLTIIFLALFTVRPIIANTTESRMPISSIVNFCHDRVIQGSTYTFCAIMEFTSDCEGWSVIVLEFTNPSPYQRGVMVWPNIPFSLPWIDDSQIESYDFIWGFASALWDSSGNYITMLQYDVAFTIVEPENCPEDTTSVDPVRSCLITPRYYMFTLEDEDQPPEWQRYCYVISNNGIPSVESQARICSVPGYDHVYRATNIPYGGWVSTDCNGMASYGWPDWQSSWYRPQFAK